MSDWCGEQRQMWIAEMLVIYGFINREHLQRKFRVSQPQASLDLQRFQRNSAGTMQYDSSRKCYVSVAGTRPPY